VANSNLIIFQSRGSKFVDNTAGIPGIDPGGLRVIGGLSLNAANVASNNAVRLEMWGSKVEDNEAFDLDIFGAWKPGAPGVAGTNNHVTVKLNGVSKRIDATATASFPAEAVATNTVTVTR
jgi:hypothetical protein